MFRHFLNETVDVFVRFSFRNVSGGIYVHNYKSLRCYCTCLSRNNIQDLSKNSSFRCNYVNIKTWRYYSRGLLDGDPSDCITTLYENELKNTKSLFPSPRETLNNYAAKCRNKVFDIHYKQSSIAPKGARKKSVNNDWSCSYVFVWPETAKFECTATTKRQAAEKAAIQALHWLWKQKRIDKTGSPLYDKEVISEIRSNLNEPLKVAFSENSLERIRKAWSEYEDSIKAIYEKTHQEAMECSVRVPDVITQDSTIDEDLMSDGTYSDLTDSDILSELRGQIHPVYGRVVQAPTEDILDRRRRQLKRKIELYQENLSPPLPIDQYMSQITSTIASNRVTIIVGAAGCGKSTRVPGAILQHGGAAVTSIVAEPRRVAAIDLAQRVAYEYGEEVGESIGYQVRLRAKPPRPPAGSLLFCTSGVLLRRLQDNPGLLGCSHVVIDEAHERDVNSDLSLCLLKRALTLNLALSLVVMSATVDIDVFTSYFDGAPVIQVPGKTYPVQVLYLEDIRDKFGLTLERTMENCSRKDGRINIDCNEIVEVIKAIDKAEGEGAILVFLPGWGEIKYCKVLLDQAFTQNRHIVVPVHSRLSTDDQSKIFDRPAPGIRKIVLCTNIAETSLTVKDATVVLDCAARRENNTSVHTGVSSLETVWVSKANAKQREGRAGRVQPGTCYKLYTREKENEFEDHATPEILRVPLDQVVLSCKSYAPEDKVENFLSQLPEPPKKKAIRQAVNDLTDLGALTVSEKLTPLGIKLSTLTLPPRMGTVLINSHTICCVVPMCNVAVSLSQQQDPYAREGQPSEIREFKRKYSPTSDHVVSHKIQDAFEEHLNNNDKSRREKIDQFVDKNGLRKDVLYNIRALSNLHLEQLLKCMPQLNNEQSEQLNKFADIDKLIVATLLTGCDRLLVTRRELKTKGKLGTKHCVYTSKGEKAHISNESVNYALNKMSSTKQPELLTYYDGLHSTDRRALVVNKTSLVSPHMAMLFCKGDFVVRDSEANDVSIMTLQRHKIDFMVPKRQAQDIIRLKDMLWKTLQYYQEVTLELDDSEKEMLVYRFKNRLIKTLGRILVEANCDTIGDRNVDDYVE